MILEILLGWTIFWGCMLQLKELRKWKAKALNIHNVNSK